MAGVEVLGIAAAAAQFVELATKVVVQLSTLPSKLRDAPLTIETTTTSLRIFVEICDDLKQLVESRSDLLRFQAPLKDIVRGCAADTLALSRILTQLVPASTDCKLKKSWKAIVSMKQEEEILRRCRRIEQFKSTLILLCQKPQFTLGLHQSNLLQQISNQGEESRARLLDLTHFIEPTISKATADIDWIKDVTNKTWTDTQKIVNILSSPENLQQRLKAQSSLPGSENGFEVISDSLHAPSSRFESYPDISANVQSAIQMTKAVIEQQEVQRKEFLQRFDDLADTLRENRITASTGLHMSATLASKPSYLREQIDDLYTQSTRPTEMYLESPPARLYKYPAQSRKRKTLGRQPLVLSLDFERTHWLAKRCADWTAHGGLVIATKYISFALHLQFTATKGAGGFSISPTIAVTRLVDRKKSLTFQLFDTVVTDLSWRAPSDGMVGTPFSTPPGWVKYHGSAKEDHFWYLMWDLSGLAKRLKFIAHRLQIAFDKGEASPTDTDIDGHTLLHELAMLSALIDAPSPEVSEYLDQIADLLIAYGVKRDARCYLLDHPMLRERFIYMRGLKGLEALDIMILDVATRFNRTPLYEQSTRAIDMLSKRGCELNNVNYGEEFRMEFGKVDPVTTTEVLRSIDGATEALNLNSLGEAIIDRSCKRLTTLLNRGYRPDDVGKVPAEAYAWKHSPLELALDWMPGLQAMLAAGADPSQAMEAAIDHGMEDTIDLFLDYDCPMWKCTSWKGPIIHHFDVRRISQKTQDKAIALAVDQRCRLWQLVTKHMSTKEVENRGVSLSEGEILDFGCLELQAELMNRNVSIPKSLQTSDSVKCTVYHETVSVSFAKKLYSVGFLDIDRPDTNRNRTSYGPTTFLRACRSGNIEMAEWILPMNPVLLIETSSVKWVAQHLLANSLAHEFCSGRYPHFLPALNRLQEPFTEDGCLCYCSLNGCNAVTALHKRLSNDTRWYYTWGRKILSMRQWLRWGQFSEVEISRAWKNFARLELFSRLGMAHTCCKYKCAFCDIEVKDAEEVNELRDEDLQSGLKSELDTFMEQYDELEARLNGDLNTLLVSWWSHIDDELPFNNMRDDYLHEVTERGSPNVGFCTEYFDYDYTAFIIALDQLEEHYDISKC